MKLKVCGITNEADALAAAQANIDYLGYVINYTLSPRFLHPRQAQQIVERVKQFYPNVQHVAVLVTPTAEFVRQLDALPFDIYQIYGDLIPTSKPIWQINASQRASRTITCAAPVIVSGGIDADNVLKFVTMCHPDIVDVNSGVESAPGKKDIQKIKQIYDLLR